MSLLQPILTTPKTIIRPLLVADAPESARQGNDEGIVKWMRNTFPFPYTLTDAENFITKSASTNKRNVYEVTVETITAPSGEKVERKTTTTVDSVKLQYAICRHGDGGKSEQSSSNQDHSQSQSQNANENKKDATDSTEAETGTPEEIANILAASPVIGGIGLKNFSATDVEARTMELGYWVGREHWGKGYTTEAVTAFVKWAFQTWPDLNRIEASMFEGNVASERVLVKAGFVFEGVRRKAVWKGGELLDQRMYGVLREEVLGKEEGVVKAGEEVKQ